MLFLPLSGNTLPHRMDERLLFCGYLIYQIVLVVSPPWTLLLALALLAGVAARLGVTARRFFSSTRRFLLILLFFAAVPPVTALLSGGAPLREAGESALLLLRLTALLLSAHLMLGILSPEGISRVLRWATRPFGALGRSFSIILLALFAILPRLEEIMRDEGEARTLRGPGIGGPLQRMRVTLYSLLREGILEADTLTEAFILRGFYIEDERREIPFRAARGQWTATLLLLLLAAAAVGSRFV